MVVLEEVFRNVLRAPMMVAPMAGVSTPRLVAAACKSGVLGFHGASFRNPQQLAQDIDEIRERIGGGNDAFKFGINLFVNEEATYDQETKLRFENARENLETFSKELGVTLAESCPQPKRLLEEQLDVVLEKKVPYFSFCFGTLDLDVIAFLQRNGTAVFGTATSVAEAVALEEAGVDAVIAQGADAGGHRGSFLECSSLVGTMSLVPQVVTNVKVPVIAAGGIMDARGIVAALSLGAEAVAMGTAFITSCDSEASVLHKNAILSSRETDTIVSDVYSGRPARGLANRFSLEYPGRENNKHRVLDQNPHVAPYPIQLALAAPIKAACLEQGNDELLALWAGQGVTLAQDSAVKDLVDEICVDLKKVQARNAEFLS